MPRIYVSVVAPATGSRNQRSVGAIMDDTLMSRFPDRITMVGGEIIRRYENPDVDPLHRAIEESREHLRPWMAWASDQLPTRAEREAVFAEWNAEPRGITYGVFDSDGRVLAGSGLHDRGGPTDIEIGYWVHACATGQGLATRIAQTLTSLAFDSNGPRRPCRPR